MFRNNDDGIKEREVRRDGVGGGGRGEGGGGEGGEEGAKGFFDFSDVDFISWWRGE